MQTIFPLERNVSSILSFIYLLGCSQKRHTVCSYSLLSFSEKITNKKIDVYIKNCLCNIITELFFILKTLRKMNSKTQLFAVIWNMPYLFLRIPKVLNSDYISGPLRSCAKEKSLLGSSGSFRLGVWVPGY